MKQTLLLLIAICISFAVSAQERETVEERRERNKLERRRTSGTSDSNIIYREFGFNTVSILQSVPILPANRSGFPNYVFFLKRKKAGKERLFRFHAGGSLGGIEFAITALDFKIGMEYPKKLTKGWEYYYGYDFISFFNGQTTSAGIGFGPIFGVKYIVNDFITFGTEGSAYFTLAGGDVTGASLNMRPLNGIFLSYKLYK